MMMASKLTMLKRANLRLLSGQTLCLHLPLVRVAVASQKSHRVMKPLMKKSVAALNFDPVNVVLHIKKNLLPKRFKIFMYYCIQCSEEIGLPQTLVLYALIRGCKNWLQVQLTI